MSWNLAILNDVEPVTELHPDDLLCCFECSMRYRVIAIDLHPTDAPPTISLRSLGRTNTELRPGEIPSMTMSFCKACQPTWDMGKIKVGKLTSPSATALMLDRSEAARAARVIRNIDPTAIYNVIKQAVTRVIDMKASKVNNAAKNALYEVIDPILRDATRAVVEHLSPPTENSP